MSVIFCIIVTRKTVYNDRFSNEYTLLRKVNDLQHCVNKPLDA